MRKFLFIILCFLFPAVLLSENIWHQTNGPFGGTVDYLCISKNGNIIAFTKSISNAKIYKTLDDGENWKQIPGDSISGIGLMPNGNYIVCYIDGSVRLYNENFTFVKILNVMNVASASMTPTILVNHSGWVFITYPYGTISASSDYGATWSKEYYNYKYNFPQCIDSNNVMYSFFRGDSVYRSEQFQPDYHAVVFPDSGVTRQCCAQSCCYNKVFNTTVVINYSNAIYISNDGGINWKKSKDTVSTINAKIICDEKGDLFLTGDNLVYKSTDGGYSWFEFLNLPECRITNSYVSDNHLFLLDLFKGILKYDLSTLEHSYYNNGLINTIIHSVTVAPNGYVFALGQERIFRSSDNGTYWKELNLNITKNYGLNEYKIYAHTDGNIYINSDTILYKSTDYGETWLTYGFPAIVSDFKISDNGRIYVVSNDLYYSDDDGNSWVNNYLGDHEFASIDVAQNRYILLGSYTSRAWFSSDTGNTWNWNYPKEVEQYGCHVGITKNLELLIALNPWSEGTKYYLSNDTGKTTVALPLPFEWYYTSHLLCWDDAIFISLYSSLRLPKQDTLYFTTDKGIQWHKETRGLENINIITCMAHYKNYYYIGTYSDGVYSCSDFSSVHEENITKNELYISPNPASDYIEITVGTQHAVSADIKIYDVFGQEEHPPTPSYKEGEIRIDVSGLPVGVYFVRVGDKVSKFVKV